MGKVKLGKHSEAAILNLVTPSPSNSHSDSDGGGEEVQDQSYDESPTSEDHSPKSGKTNLTQLSPSTPSPSSTVKGKKNSWEWGKTKKMPFASKSKHLTWSTAAAAVIFFFFEQVYHSRIKSPPLLQMTDRRYQRAVSDDAGKPMSCKRSKSAIIGLHSPAKVQTPAMIRAEEILSGLGSEFPSFAKPMVRSHVSSCFWMGLPIPFSKSHLPKKDSSLLLEDESGGQFEVKYIQGRWGLSGGWRTFAMGHKLLEGDVLIFQLVEPNKLKVFIVRANDLTEVDGALSLLNLDAHAKQDDTEKDDVENGTVALDNKKRKRPKSLPVATTVKKNKASIRKPVPKLTESVEQIENGCKDVGAELLVGPRFSTSEICFRDVKSFKHFHILVDGSSIDSEIPKNIRVKYFNLCRSRNTLLHSRLLRGLNIKLVAGTISETVNIADAIGACKLTTSQDEFKVWEKSLKSFELMGMNVGFLRARLRRLVSLAIEIEVDVDIRKYIDAKTGKVQADDEIRNLEAKVVKLKATSGKYGAVIGALKSKAEGYEHKFQAEVDAPW